MKEWSFGQFLEDFDTEKELDNFPPKLQEKLVAILRKAYISGYDEGVKHTTLQFKKEEK